MTKKLNYLDDSNVTYIPDSKKTDVKDYQLWKIYNSASEVPDSQTYSIYWNTDESNVPPLTVGFDAGKYATDLNLTYANSGATQDVTIRTNGGTLTINAANDTVRHYGNAATVNVTAIADHSYHAHGTVGVITVNQGHVVVENGATVSTITKSSDAAENAVSITNNGTITASVGVEVSGTAPATKVEDKDIKSTLTDAGGYVKLKATQTISSSLTISKDTVLDLNGQTLMLGENQILVQSNLTVIDTTNDQGKICKTNNTPSKNTAIQVKEGGNLIINGGNFSTQHKQMIDVASQSSLTINGGKIETNNMGVYVFGTDAKCTINGGEFKTGSACVSGNGSNDKWGTYIEINGGKLVSDNDIAIYHPQVGALVINGGYVKGATAIYQKAGTMTINGGVFEATMEYKDYQYKGTGANPTGDCILFDACTGYGNGSIVANISLNSTKISVNANSIGKAQKVKGYVYNSDNAPIIIWNGEAVTSIDVSSK